MKSQQSAKHQPKKEKGKQKNLITVRHDSPEERRVHVNDPTIKPAILFDFLEICGLFLERVLDVFGYDFKSSLLKIFCNMTQTNREGRILMVEYF